MVRVAYFAPWLFTGGTQRHLQQVIQQLDRSRFEPTVFTLRPGGDVEDELRAAGVPVTSLGIGANAFGPRALRGMLRAARQLRRDGVSVVHGYQWRPALIGALAARLAGVPLVVAGKRSLTGRTVSERLAWRAIARLSDTVVVNAEALRVQGEQLGMHARWAVLRNGVDVARFAVVETREAARLRLGLEPSRSVVGTIGRLEPRKGYEVLLAAMQLVAARTNGTCPQVLLVGDGPLRDALERRTDEIGLGHVVRFTGNLSDVRPALAAMDVFVLPSHEEGMSNALLEAMAAERAVVATAVGGTGEIVAHERTGLLVPPADPAMLAAAVQRLLEDRATAARLAEAGREFVCREYGARQRTAELEQLYLDGLARRRGGR
ncbi:MAG TPA: glycosyltransferase [Candidatus Limnocylindria bacterium]|nr:glycosyltransferase [Candidatus Limnocylindria bacterium]